MLQAVGSRPFTTEAWVQFQASPCGVCGVRNDTGTGFCPPSTPDFALSVTFHQSSTLVFNFILISSEGQAGEA